MAFYFRATYLLVKLEFFSYLGNFINNLMSLKLMIAIDYFNILPDIFFFFLNPLLELIYEITGIPERSATDIIKV